MGTDTFHTPKRLKDFLFEHFKSCGLSVDIDSPFSGSIVPNSFYKNEKRVETIMIEIRRDLYIDEKTYKKNVSFSQIRNTLGKTIKLISEGNF